MQRAQVCWAPASRSEPARWTAVSELTAGEFNHDTGTDLIAVDYVNRTFWLYPGTPTGGEFGPRIEIGTTG